MRIIRVKIKNYRNLDDTEVFLNPNMNFLVGENDLGKSNFLDMLNKLFYYSNFSENDFKDEEKPIKIEFSLYLDEVEKGIFEDYFDPENNNVINVIAEQKEPDERLMYFHSESGDEIYYTKFRCVNFIKYDSLRTPKDELKFYRGKGVSKFLSYMVNKYILKDKDFFKEDIINKESVDPVISYINENISKIRSFKDFMINVHMEDELSELIHSILTIKDSNGFEIENMGYGAQFSILILLDILENLMDIVENKRQKDRIFEKDGELNVSLILGLDEPEIHLHPYMQRNLIKYIKKILDNKEDKFCELAKDLFNIDKINGQCIVVTHSPNVLLDNYKNIIRFYQDNGKVKIKSGESIELDEYMHKHLLKNLHYIKEIFFSRCNILVEGDSEYGALPIFAEKLNCELDELGISIVKAGGAESIPPLIELLSKFGISSVGIIDKQQFNDLTNDGTIKEYMVIHSTNGKDFEEEMFDAFEIEDYIEFIENNFQGTDRFFFVKSAKELGIEIDCGKPELHNQIRAQEEELKEQLKYNLREKILDYMGDNKTIIFGRDLASYVSKVPESYKNVVEDAERLSQDL